MKRIETKTKIITVSLPVEVVEKMDRMMNLPGWNRSAYITGLIRKDLDYMEGLASAFKLRSGADYGEGVK